MLWIRKSPSGFRSSAAFILFTSFAFSALAQNSLASSSKGSFQFEVATIKPVDTQASGIIVEGTEVAPGGVVRLQALSLKEMLVVAFNVQYWQIEGGEAWMEKNLYNVVGEPSDEMRRTLPDTRHTLDSIQDPRLREMLQTLLTERFALKVHRTTQTGKVYSLERTGKSLALHPRKTPPADQPAAGGRFGSIGFAGQWTLYDTTMPELAQFASGYVFRRPVLDRTGLTGAFDYRSESEDFNTHQADPVGSFLGLLKQAGLKVEPGSGPVEMLTIDHADLPLPN